MTSAFRSFFSVSSRFTNPVTPRIRATICPSTQTSKLATIANGRIFFRSKHIDYTQKYADKLKMKAEKEGVATLDELKAKFVPATQTAFKKAHNATSVAEEHDDKTPKLTVDATKNASPTTPGPNESGNPTLDKIMRLELIKDLSAEEIGKIWIQKHIDQEDTVSAVVPEETYRKFLARSQKYPMFLLPLSHGDGVEFYLLQFAFHQVIFTSLLEYKTHKENARPFLTLTHYPELIDSKGIVLMNGSITSDPRVLTVEQAQILIFGLQQYYVSDHKEKQQLLHNFHKNPELFSHEKLIQLTEISG